MGVLKASLATLNILHAKRIETLTALDSSIRLVNYHVNPEAGGCVNAWQGRYGKRGAVNQYVLWLLRDAVPDALSIKYLVSCLAAHFNLPLESKEDCFRIRRVLTTKLKCFRTKGLAESLHEGNSPGLWRLSPLPGMAGLLNPTAKKLQET